MDDPDQTEKWKVEALVLNILLGGQKASVTREITNMNLIDVQKSKKQLGSSLAKGSAVYVLES